MSMFQHYREFGRDILRVSREMSDAYQSWLALVVAILWLLSPELARLFSAPLSLPLWARIIPLTILVLYVLLRTNYLRFQDIERQRDTASEKLSELTKRPTLRVLEIKEWSIPGGSHHHYSLRIYNDGPGTANNVQVRLQAIEPRPSYSAFRGEFPYPLADLNGHRGPRSISEHEEEPYQLARSWAGGLGETTVAGLDGLVEMSPGHPEDWKISLEQPCVLRLSVSYSDTVQHLAVALKPEGGRLNPRLVF
jgi:hypothetical protein